MSEKWHKRYLQMARLVATWSKDRSTQVGAVIVASDRTPGPYGYNGFPRNIDDDVDERHDRTKHKYKWTEHAERNAIFNAVRMGVRLDGSTIYVTHFPCSDCARAIIQAGIERVVVDKASMGDGGFADRWGEDMTVSKEMLEEAGLALDAYDVEDTMVEKAHYDPTKAGGE